MSDTNQPPNPSEPANEELLIEAMVSAHRERGRDGLRFHPAFHDLSEDARMRAHEQTLLARRIEAGLDPEGMFTSDLARRVGIDPGMTPLRPARDGAA